MIMKYRAVLWEYPEGEPGGGDWGSNLSYDELPKTPWYKTKQIALEAGKVRLKIYYGTEFGDFYVRIEEYHEVINWFSEKTTLDASQELKKFAEIIKMYLLTHRKFNKETARKIFYTLNDHERSKTLSFISKMAAVNGEERVSKKLWSTVGLQAFRGPDDVKMAIEGGGLPQNYKNMLLLNVVAKGDIELTQLLLLSKANIAIRKTSKDGFQPIHIAVWLGNLDLVQLILDFGGDPYSINGFGETALDMAKKSTKEMFELLRNFKW